MQQGRSTWRQRICWHFKAPIGAGYLNVSPLARPYNALWPSANTACHRRFADQKDSANMLNRISSRDKLWLFWALVCVLYFSVLSASNCNWNNAPLAFVRGCKNYGIDWNAFMAPIGAVVVLLLPLTLLYWVLRAFQVLLSKIRQLAAKILKGWKNKAQPNPSIKSGRLKATLLTPLAGARRPLFQTLWVVWRNHS